MNSYSFCIPGLSYWYSQGFLDLSAYLNSRLANEQIFALRVSRTFSPQKGLLVVRLVLVAAQDVALLL